MAEIEGAAFRAALGHFCTGVVIATGCVDGQPTGFAAQSFSSVSLDPPLIALCPAKTSTSWPKLRSSGSFCVNILGADQKVVCETFARSGIDKFADIKWRAGVTGSPIIEGIVAYIDCDLETEHDAGDHTIAIGRVRELHIVQTTQAAPLLFFRGGYGSFQDAG